MAEPTSIIRPVIAFVASERLFGDLVGAYKELLTQAGCITHSVSIGGDFLGSLRKWACDLVVFISMDRDSFKDTMPCVRRQFPDLPILCVWQDVSLGRNLLEGWSLDGFYDMQVPGDPGRLLAKIHAILGSKLDD